MYILYTCKHLHLADSSEVTHLRSFWHSFSRIQINREHGFSFRENPSQDKPLVGPFSSRLKHPHPHVHCHINFELQRFEVQFFQSNNCGVQCFPYLLISSIAIWPPLYDTWYSSSILGS